MNPLSLIIAAVAVVLSVLMAAWALMERARANRAEERAWEASQKGADPETVDFTPRKKRPTSK